MKLFERSCANENMHSCHVLGTAFLRPPTTERPDALSGVDDGVASTPTSRSKSTPSTSDAPLFPRDPGAAVPLLERACKKGYVYSNKMPATGTSSPPSPPVCYARTYPPTHAPVTPATHALATTLRSSSRTGTKACRPTSRSFGGSRSARKSSSCSQAQRTASRWASERVPHASCPLLAFSSPRATRTRPHPHRSAQIA